ncbi:VRR-NUC domain-containing protein [Ruminococcus sp.]|uniref:VRR-NUC domain-containing protein n=1 Tax=Ruminococcus sp. TaxID=41978 RepID=UPI0025EAECE6|nr:VRR-NUC domain-containing protein [Ruminococcus sp.]
MDDEKQVERYLCQCVQRVGGKAYKWTSPGCCGVPDRLVFLPGGAIIPVETKAPERKGNLSKAQRLQMMRLAEMGTMVYVLSTREEVDRFMQKQIAKYGLTE